MKKFTLLLILTLGFSSIHSQWSVTLFKNRDFLNFNSASDQITVLEIDHDGNLWFNLYNTFGGGGGFLTGAGMVKFTGEEWISFNSAYMRDFLSLNVNAVAFDLVDSVWVGTDNGLAQFDGISQVGWKIYNTKNSLIPNNKITAIAVDNKNIKWIGFSNGILASFNGYEWKTFDKYSGTGIKINDLETDMEGNIWVARTGTPGLLKFDGENFITFPALTDIRNIEIDQKGQVLVTTINSLVIIRNDEIVEIVQPDPLLGCELYEVEALESNIPDGITGIFVSTNKGILKKENLTFRLFSKNNSALPDLVPTGNLNSVPLVSGENDSVLWFSFVYEGISASYASIGYMTSNICAIPPIISKEKPEMRFCFGESITLDANADAANYIWDGVKSTDRTFTVYDTKTIELALDIGEVCHLRDTLAVYINNVWIDSVICVMSNQTYLYSSAAVLAQHVYEDEVPCVVTVSPENKNLIVWERTPEVGTASYNIYIEKATGEFEFLANLPADLLSVFEDSLSDPKKRSYKYKIASVDTCGNESGPSFYHKTMHLQVFPGADTTEVHLTWQNYEGFWFPYYIIFKGTDPDNLQRVDSIPWDDNNLTWTDYGVNGRYYYRVGVRLPFQCAPAKNQGKKVDSGPYSQSMSNIEDNRLETFIGEPGFMEILAYPNPFRHWTQIDFNNPMKYTYQLKVTDMSGKTVRMVNDIRDNKVILLREDLPQGLYLFELKGDKVYRGKFVVR